MLDKLLSRPVPKGDPRHQERRDVRQKARAFKAAALVGQGKIQDADTVFLNVLREDPFYELPPGEFPSPVQDRFIEVRRQNHEELERLKQAIMRKRQLDVEELAKIAKLKREREEKLEAMAAEEKLVEVRSRLVAMVPFGVGQFHNGDWGLGGFFLGSEVVMIAGAITTAAIFQHDVEDFVRECTGPIPREIVDPSGEARDCDAGQTKLEALRVANWLFIGSAFSLIVAGIIEAQVSFTPQTIIQKKRPIPPRIKDPPPLTIEPSGGVSDTGFFLGVRGRF